MPIYCGIDLGSANTVVSLCDAEGTEPILFDDDVFFPSCIFVDTDGAVFVGRAAKSRQKFAPDRLIAFDRAKMPDRKIQRINGRDWTPEDVACEILRFVAETIRSKTGSSEPIHAVITIPFLFSDEASAAAARAAQAAGLRCVQLLHEPAAAACACSECFGAHGRILAASVGGDAFDLAVVSAGSGTFFISDSRSVSGLGAGTEAQPADGRALPDEYRARMTAALQELLSARPGPYDAVLITGERAADPGIPAVFDGLAPLRDADVFVPEDPMDVISAGAALQCLLRSGRTSGVISTVTRTDVGIVLQRSYESPVYFQPIIRRGTRITPAEPASALSQEFYNPSGETAVLTIVIGESGGSSRPEECTALGEYQYEIPPGRVFRLRMTLSTDRTLLIDSVSDDFHQEIHMNQL